MFKLYNNYKYRKKIRLLQEKIDTFNSQELGNIKSFQDGVIKYTKINTFYEDLIKSYKKIGSKTIEKKEVLKLEFDFLLKYYNNHIEQILNLPNYDEALDKLKSFDNELNDSKYKNFEFHEFIDYLLSYLIKILDNFYNIFHNYALIKKEDNDDHAKVFNSTSLKDLEKTKNRPIIHFLDLDKDSMKNTSLNNSKIYKKSWDISNRFSNVKIVDFNAMYGYEYKNRSYGGNTRHLQDVFDNLALNIEANNLDLINLEKLDNVLFAQSKTLEAKHFINQLLAKISPGEVKLVLIDFTQLGFLPYGNLPHLLTEILIDPAKSKQFMLMLLFEMMHRYELLLKNNSTNISSYNKTREKKLPYIIVIINEIDVILENMKSQFSKILRSKEIGIIIVSFSRFSIKNLKLTEMADLFKVYENYYADYLAEEDKKRDLNIANIDDKMTGFDFEKYVGKLLLANGFTDVNVSQKSNDFGVDIIAQKDHIKYAFQCKRHSSPVGIKAVQEVIASKVMNDSHVAVVLTNNYFTASAKKLAAKNNVLLWDKEKLAELIRNV